MAVRSVTLRWLALLLIALGGGCASGDGSEPVDVSSMDAASPDDVVAPDGSGADATDAATPRPKRLHARGTELVDADGAVVRLRGVNLGGWLFHETWVTLVDYSLQARAYVLGHEMGLGDEFDAVLREIGPMRKRAMAVVKSEEQWLAELETALVARVGEETARPFLDALATYDPDVYDDADKPLRLKLEERFGTEVRDELLDIFAGAWLRESDVAWLADHGFDLVRVPVGYRSLVTTSDAAPLTTLVWNERAFARLDALFDWCEAHGVWAVLDVQESPGGHNDYSGVPTLYTDPAMQALTVQLWEELSRRYADRDAIAAYSLLAEPMSAPSATARDEMYDRLVKAIRARGDDHLLVIHDGFLGMESLPDPAAYGWEGVVYSTHLFEWTATNLAYYDMILNLYETMFTNAQARHGVPYFIGSFSTMADTDWAYEAAAKMVDWYESHAWSWALWTYKRLDDPIDALVWSETTSWGLRGRMSAETIAAFDRPDVFRDDLATLRRKMAAYADLEALPNETLLEVLTRPMRTE